MRAMRSLIPFLFFLGAARAASGDSDTYYHSVDCPVQDRKDELEVTIVLPHTDRNGSSPIVVFYNGFELRSCVYLPYAQYLASRGYAVLMLDDTKSPFSDINPRFSDAARVAWLPAALDCAKQQSRFRDRLDFDTVAVAGHSRGGKIAGLFYAEHAGTYPWLKTAFLVDPVDTPVKRGDKCTPMSPSYDGDDGATPNLARWAANLTSSSPMGVLGTGLQSSCNCNSSGYREVWGDGNLPQGSWLATLPRSGHLQVLDDSLAQCNLDSAFHRLLLRVIMHTCARGTMDGDQAVPIAARVMAEWFDTRIQHRPVSAEFEAWLQQEKADGSIMFQVQSAAASTAGPAVTAAAVL